MDLKFTALVVVGSAAAFFGTWTFLDQPSAVEPVKAAAVPAAVRNPGGKLVVIKDCDHARAMGVAPLMAGRPGYRAELDFDGDGFACSPA